MALRPVAIAPGVTARLLARLDAMANRVYGSRFNPLYRSGTITVAMLAVLLVTGVYLLLFYRIGSPYASVARITDQAWAGRWIRGVHRLSSDAALITAIVHAIRMFAQRRTWGRRVVPWVSGVGLVALILVCGWTGYVMVWDTFGQIIAVEGARILDLVPLFSEPVGRAFVGHQPVPGAFFFLNLFLHIALPIGMGIGLMLHVSRVARPLLFPPRPVIAWSVAALIVVAVVRPVMLAPEADALRLPASVPIDVFYAFWIPVARNIPAAATVAGFAGLLLLASIVPRLTRPSRNDEPPASVVDERVCTGCEQCVQDCPYEAIAMIARSDDRPTLVARVDPSRCVSCGICAGSCAPMGVGPAGRTGRDQLAAARAFAQQHAVMPSDVVVIACSRGAGDAARDAQLGAPVFAVDCAGSLHTSVVEQFLQAGAGGVLVLACPPEDCWNREGAVWLEQRVYHDREAELQARVDRRRVAVANLTLADRAGARAALERLRDEVRRLDRAAPDDIDLLRLCDAEAGVGGDAA
ncbi:MAG: hydrogenase iron-sulfur subunit [Gemmatimonadaceae bacterium]|nr:hydrogenase iron-sulfur subunit [Gemmatimonadaceae bacterium]